MSVFQGSKIDVLGHLRSFEMSLVAPAMPQTMLNTQEAVAREDQQNSNPPPGEQKFPTLNVNLTEEAVISRNLNSRAKN